MMKATERTVLIANGIISVMKLSERRNLFINLVKKIFIKYIAFGTLYEKYFLRLKLLQFIIIVRKVFLLDFKFFSRSILHK